MYCILNSIVAAAVNCTATNCVFANKFLRFGTGSESSINAYGFLKQPFYFSPSLQQWFQLTYFNYPLDLAIGTKTGPNWSGSTVQNLYDLSTPSVTLNYSSYIVTSTVGSNITVGHGTITSEFTANINGDAIKIKQAFTLREGFQNITIKTTLFNMAASDIGNVYLWVGTKDDYIGTNDRNNKTRGNLQPGNKFTAITSNGADSSAIKVSNDVDTVFIYTYYPGTNTAYARYGPFSNVYNTNPSSLAPATLEATDGSYALVMPIGTIAVGAYVDVTWYYQGIETAALPDMPTKTPTFAPTREPTAKPTAPTGVPSGQPTSMPTRTDDSKVMNLAAIVAPVVGGVVLLGIVAYLMFCTACCVCCAGTRKIHAGKEEDKDDLEMKGKAP